MNVPEPIIIKKLDKIYEGKAKILYKTENPQYLIQFFKDDTTAFNNIKKEIIKHKGILNNYISEFLMSEIAKNKISNHFIKKISDREQLIKFVKIIPLEIIIRNYTAGSMAKRLGIKEGIKINNPIFEICYKDDSLGDPLIYDSHAIDILKIISQNDLNFIRNTSLEINKILINIFSKININLIDFKLEFGFYSDGNIILADEISPDSCRLWDKDSNEKLDKDIFRRNLGDLVVGYKKIANLLNISLPTYV